MNDCSKTHICTPKPEETYQVFISYSSKDFEIAKGLEDRLRNAGFSVWFDKFRLNKGCNWHREIESACEHSRVKLPVLTPRWKLSEWTKYETYGSEAIIPLVFEGQWEDVATPPLRALQNLQINLSDNSDDAWQKLFAALWELLKCPEPEKVTHMACLRYRSNFCFVGREALLNEIHEKLHVLPTTSLTQGRLQVITAPGGMGKTALARQYAEKFWRCYRQMFWVDCRRSLVTEFAHVADLLFPNRSKKDLSERQWAEGARQELRQTVGRPSRLLILDDATKEESILEWIPTTGNCHTIITSRFAQWSPGAEVLPVWFLEKEPARDLLLLRTNRRVDGSEAHACDTLAEMLDYLPLALEQAAAYINKQGTGFGFQDCLQLYKKAKIQFLKIRVSGATEYTESLYATWKTALDRLSPEARILSQLLAFFAPTPIPMWVLIQAIPTIAERLRHLAPRRWDPSSLPSEVELRHWKDELANYSLLRIEDGDAISCLSLMQAVERDQIPKPERPDWIQQAMGLLVKAAPVPSDDFAHWPTWRVLLPHAKGFWEQAIKDQRVFPSPDLLTELAAFLHVIGCSAEAEGPARKDVELRTRQEGKENRSTLTSLALLATILRATGKFEESEQLYRKTLEIGQRVLPANDQANLAFMNNLAGLLIDQNCYTEAESLYHQSLDGSENTLGHDHEDTINSIINLAFLKALLGKYSESESLYLRAERTCERKYGPTHRDTIVCLIGLATVRESQGQYPEARALFQLAKDRALQPGSLGQDHPITQKCMNNLALLLANIGEYGEAEALAEHVHRLREQMWGPDHPDTLVSLTTCVRIKECQGKFVEAVKIYSLALKGAEQRLGQKHLTTLVCRDYLAGALEWAGQLQEAKALYRKALLYAKRSLGKNHRFTLTIANNLGVFLTRQNNLSRARLIFQHVLDIRDVVLGKIHPETLQTVRNLAATLRNAKRFQEAEAVLISRLELLQRQHPDMNSLINAYRKVLGQSGAEPSEIENKLSRFDRE